MRSTRRGLAALALVTSLSLVACGGASEAAPGDPAPETAAFEAPAELRVGHIAGAGSHMAAVRAMDEGYFEEAGFEGTEFSLHGFAGGAVIVPAIVAGEIDFAVSNWVSVVAALAQGIDLRILAENERNSAGNQEVLTLGGSDITSPSDLEGRTVGINTLNGISHLAILLAVEEDGGDPALVEFREIPFTEMAGVLERGHVDAIQTPSPFTVLVPRQIDAVTAFDLEDSEAFRGMPIGGYIGSPQLAEESPEVLLRVEDALRKGREDLGDEAVKAALFQREEVSSMPPDLAEHAARLAPEAVEPDWSEVQRIADAMLEFGFIDEPVTITDHVLSR